MLRQPQQVLQRGVRGLRLRLVHATAIRNRADPACGVTADCADVASAQRPVVAGVSLCETSRRTTSSGDWDVCTVD